MTLKRFERDTCCTKVKASRERQRVRAEGYTPTLVL